MAERDGGPAFPAKWEDHHDYQGEPDGTGGMSLRDWFAGQALNGMCAQHRVDPIERRARIAYEIADAMLTARHQEDKDNG